MNYKLFVGIDQSKLTFDASVIKAEEAGKNHHQQFENNAKGFNKMIRWVKGFGASSLKEVLFCSEHTGIYSLKLSMFMAEKKADLWLENPLQIRLSSGLKRGKTDKADAKQIALYCFNHKQQVRLYQLPSRSMLALKQLLTFRERLIKQQVGLKATIKDLDDLNADVLGLVSQSSRQLIKILEKKIIQINEKMLELISQDEALKKQFELVKSVHGVGKQTALTLMVYTNAFTLFSEWRKLSCYCGMAPFEFSSGTSIRGKTRVSKMGNRKLKSLLTMCALNTIKKENEFKIYYDRRIAEGKSAMSTINVLRNKIISRIFAVVKRGTPYEPTLKTIA